MPLPSPSYRHIPFVRDESSEQCTKTRNLILDEKRRRVRAVLPRRVRSSQIV